MSATVESAPIENAPAPPEEKPAQLEQPVQEVDKKVRQFKGGGNFDVPPFHPLSPKSLDQVRTKLRLCLPTYRDTFVASAVGSIFMFVSWLKSLEQNQLGWKDVVGPGCSRTGEKKAGVFCSSTKVSK